MCITTISPHDVVKPLAQVQIMTTELLDSICNICGDVMGSDTGCGAEVAYKLPCSHVFGSACIIRWLQISPKQDCPNCRRKMVHRGCGHLIMPSPVSTAPPTITEAETPDDCVRCRGEEKVGLVVKKEHDRLLKNERALRGVKSFLPKFFGGSQPVEEEDIEERIVQLRKGFDNFHERAWRDWEERERRIRW